MLSKRPGESVNLVATISSQAPPKLSWTLNGADVEMNRNVSMIWQEDTATLSISKVDASYAGVYELRAANQSGEAKDSVQLKVAGGGWLGAMVL